MDPQAVTSVFGGMDTEPKPDPVPSELTFAPTKVKDRFKYSVICLVLNDPKVVVDVAINDPDAILKGSMPAGLIKILHMGTKEECIKYVNKSMADNKFDRLSLVKSGHWVKLTGNNEDKDIIESNSRSILYSEITKSKSKSSEEKRKAMERFNIDKKYSERLDDPDDIMHFAQLKLNAFVNTKTLMNAQETITKASDNLDKITDRLSHIATKHPEFIENWREHLDKFCKETGVNNPLA